MTHDWAKPCIKKRRFFQRPRRDRAIGQIFYGMLFRSGGVQISIDVSILTYLLPVFVNPGPLTFSLLTTNCRWLLNSGEGSNTLNTESERRHNSIQYGETHLHRRYFKHARDATIYLGMLYSRHTRPGHKNLEEAPNAPFRGCSHCYVVFKYIPIEGMTQKIIWVEQLVRFNMIHAQLTQVYMPARTFCFSQCHSITRQALLQFLPVCSQLSSQCSRTCLSFAHFHACSKSISTQAPPH